MLLFEISAACRKKKAVKLREWLVAQYHLTSLTRPDGVEEWQRKHGHIAKLSQLSLRLEKG